jgi:hypothetical protein
MSLNPEPVPEFSRPIPRERLGGQVVTEEISATPEERAALARRFGLVGLDLLRATVKIEAADGTGSKGGGGLLRLSGHLSAELSQACVVTLEPVASRIEEDFSLLYSLEPGPTPAPVNPEGAGPEVVVDAEAEAPPELLGPGGLDLGEAVAQQLAVALDPYPRAPGAAFEEVPGPAGVARRGFAALEALKRDE